MIPSLIPLAVFIGGRLNTNNDGIDWYLGDLKLEFEFQPSQFKQLSVLVQNDVFSSSRFGVNHVDSLISFTTPTLNLPLIDGARMLIVERLMNAVKELEKNG
jgi:hypothetical protein